MEYRKEIKCGNVLVVQRLDYEWGVIDNEGNEIVPFGKYGWIDRFDSGLARVKSFNGIVRATYNSATDEFGPNEKPQWGIINEKGIEVLPLEYDEIWNFFGKNRLSTKVIKDGIETDLFLHDLNPSIPNVKKTARSTWYRNDDESHYVEYAGSYAQDEMGYSDELINDAFEGDPDAYWNID